MSTFPNTMDRKSIVSLVRDIERHPCLYNVKSIQYTDRELKRKTWINIAKRLNATVTECKEKWRKIRTAYNRSLKPKYLNGIRIASTPYYLASHLKFIAPIEKRSSIIRRTFLLPSKNKIISSCVIVKKELNTEMEQRCLDSEDELITQDAKPIEPFEQMFSDEDNISFVDDVEIISNNGTGLNNKETIKNNLNKTTEVKRERHKDVHNCDKITKRCTYCVNIERKPRKMFLFSILPEINDFTDQQMRCFRRGLIDLIDKCKYSDA